MKKTIIALALTFSFGSAFAGSYNDAVSAYREGNFVEAVKSFYDLANKQDPDAQYVLGTLFERGDKIERDMAQAIHWYEQAAIRGNPFAQAAFAAHLVSGEFAQRDLTRALGLYMDAAAQGHAQSQFNAAYMFENSVGTKANIERAKPLYEKAAEQGNLRAQFNLGRLLIANPSSDNDLVQGYKWLKAVENHKGSPYADQAKEIRDEAARHMTPDQIAAAHEAMKRIGIDSIMVAAPVVRHKDAKGSIATSGAFK